MKYKLLFILSYVLYAVSFFIPAYVGESFSFCCGGSRTWFGYECAISVFAFIFSENTLMFIALSMPNVLMIILLFTYKRTGIGFVLILLLFNFCSCSYWWVTALSDGDIASLLPGYWLWFLSITGNNVLLLLSKRKTT
ncbi:hypothetical protein ES705_19589 [subsurface metagenome]